MTDRFRAQGFSALPLVVLVLYALGFAWTALGNGTLAGGDHPGQLYRVTQALTVGVWPWRLNPGWWAGYAELQYYPPGMAYLGALLHGASLGRLDGFATYQALLWMTLLLPGFTMYALLARVLGNPWLALVGGFLALTLSAGSRSGVEEGLRWGMIAARLGWGVLPLLALALHRWTERRAAPLAAAVLLAAVMLFHPAHWPAGIAIVILAAWHGPGSRRARLRDAGLLAAAGTGLAAFWLLPLVVHRSMALPLAWGDHSLLAVARTITACPLSLALLAVSALAWWTVRRSQVHDFRWLCGWAPSIMACILVDALVVQRLGILWLPADRLVDSLLLALIVGACVGLAVLCRRLPGIPVPSLALASIGLCVLLSFWGKGEDTLSLWPRSGPNEWPKYEELTRRLQLPGLWEALRNAPPGRILFLRSSVPLENWPDWWRPRSHVTALAPLLAGREILNGTFTHPSPIAGMVYTGSPANQPLTMLVEERDGVTLFGRRLAALDARAFDALADQFLVSTVVALAEDEGRLGFLEDNPRFSAPAQVGLFRIFGSSNSHETPEAVGVQQWRVTVPPHQDGWRSVGVAYSPLWHVSAGGQVFPTRRSELGLLEVRMSRGETVQLDLVHRPGAVEWGGLALSVATGLALLAIGYHRHSQPRMARTA